jgi:hypothetical protein
MLSQPAIPEPAVNPKPYKDYLKELRLSKPEDPQISLDNLDTAAVALPSKIKLKSPLN